MANFIQDGIYFDGKKEIGKSLCLLFLKISHRTNSLELAKELSDLWKMYVLLKIGKTKKMDIDKKYLYHGNLSVLIGYEPKIFNGIVSGIKKTKPNDLIYEKGFRGPSIQRGESIVNGSSFLFSKNIIKNHAVDDHIIIQFIADDEMFTNRALVETWKFIKERQNSILKISKYYTGFKQISGRGWLGFHDGISNINRSDRYHAIAINDSVPNQDKWLINGTYMTFVRFIIDLEKWEMLNIREQEMIIGRKKTTGCPIIGFDNVGNPISDTKCPANGSEVIDKNNENEIFRESFPKIMKFNNSLYNKNQLSNSHIHRSRNTSNYPLADYRSLRIFRQGFDFIESTTTYPGFRVGLNFISFQNTSNKIMKLLTSPQWLGKSVISYNKNSLSLDKFVSATAAGLYLIPPTDNNEKFPGSVIFL